LRTESAEKGSWRPGLELERERDSGRFEVILKTPNQNTMNVRNMLLGI
jgi:hypothetical protein